VQHPISFSFTANMKEITNDKSNYIFEQRIFVSVWEHEQRKTGKTMKNAWEKLGQVSLTKKRLLRLKHKYIATDNLKENSRTKRSSKDQWKSEMVRVPRCRSPGPCPPQQQDTICCKNLSQTLLMIGKRMPETR